VKPVSKNKRTAVLKISLFIDISSDDEVRGDSASLSEYLTVIPI